MTNATSAKSGLGPTPPTEGSPIKKAEHGRCQASPGPGKHHPTQDRQCISRLPNPPVLNQERRPLRGPRAGRAALARRSRRAPAGGSVVYAARVDRLALLGCFPSIDVRLAPVGGGLFTVLPGTGQQVRSPRRVFALAAGESLLKVSHALVCPGHGVLHTGESASTPPHHVLSLVGQLRAALGLLGRLVSPPRRRNRTVARVARVTSHGVAVSRFTPPPPFGPRASGRFRASATREPVHLGCRGSLSRCHPRTPRPPRAPSPVPGRAPATKLCAADQLVGVGASPPICGQSWSGYSPTTSSSGGACCLTWSSALPC